MKPQEQKEEEQSNFQEEVSAAEKLACADVFILFKEQNETNIAGWPNKLGDYLMASKPIIYAINAGNDPVRETGVGINAEPYNTEELEDALQRFCAMTQVERNAMGMNGRRYALENLDWEILGRRYADICESLLHDR